MKKKKIILIIIICILTIIIGGIGYGFYKFFSSNKKDNKEKINEFKYIYVCGRYENDKYYSTSDTGNCIKKKFSCTDCEIESQYHDNFLIYYTNNKIVNIYDLKNSKIVESLDVYVAEGGDIQAWVEYYIQDSKLYGFTYTSNNDDLNFYNLSTMKTIERIEGSICTPSLEYTYIPCELQSDNIIENNLAIITKNVDSSAESVFDEDYKYGLINLKTGETKIKVEQDYIEKKGDYYITNNTFGGLNGIDIYDENGNIIFDNQEGNELYHANIIGYTYSGYFLVYNNDYICIIDKNGKILKNSKIKQNEISNNIYNKITNSNAKENYPKDLGVFYSVFGEKSSLYDESENLYLSFTYTDEYYETYVTLYYKYNLLTNNIEVYEDDYFYGY